MDVYKYMHTFFIQNDSPRFFPFKIFVIFGFRVLHLTSHCIVQASKTGSDGTRTVAVAVDL